MKDRSMVAIQYSGYPLSVADLIQKPKQKTSLSIVNQASAEISLIKMNQITNDPKNWDENWFNNYE